MSSRRIYIGGFRGVPVSINLPKARVGERVAAEHIEKITREIDMNKVQNSKGSSLKRSSGGTSITPKRKFDPPAPWRVYNNGGLIVVENGHVYGSESEKVGLVDANSFSGMRDKGTYNFATGYELFHVLPNAQVIDGDPWSISFSPENDCTDWIIYLRTGPRPSLQKTEAGKDIPNSDGKVTGGSMVPAVLGTPLVFANTFPTGSSLPSQLGSPNQYTQLAGSGSPPPPTPEPEEEEEEEEEDASNTLKKPPDQVAFLDIAAYDKDHPSELDGGVPIAILEAIRDPDGEPQTDTSPEKEACLGKQPFLYWNVIQIARSDVGLERTQVKRHPFELSIDSDGVVFIEQGFVFSYPNDFVNTGIGDLYLNAVKLGDSIAPVTDGKENDPVDPLKEDGTPKTDEEIADEQADKDEVKASKYLLNANLQSFEVREGDWIFLNFFRVPDEYEGSDAALEEEESLRNWKCTLEISNIMPTNTLGGAYNISQLGACQTDYPACGDWVLKSEHIAGQNIVYFERQVHAKHVSSGNQAYPIAKIVNGQIVQFLRSDFFFYPPLDSAVAFKEVRFSIPTPPDTPLEPSEGEDDRELVPDEGEGTPPEEPPPE